MKSLLIPLVLLSVVCAIALWAGIHWFVSTTDDALTGSTVSSSASSPDLRQPDNSVVDQTAVSSSAETRAGSGPLQLKTGVALLGENEVESREAARRQRLIEAGIISGTKQPESTIAIDVSLAMPENCKGAAIAGVPIGVKFRHESPTIKGSSLNDLESLVALYRACASAQFILAKNPLGRIDATETLTQMRFDELKYFFIQHSVSIDAVQYSEE
ncbi:MAG: hypothetical protein AB8B97_06730 [Granulosicoccus sp.]